MQTSLHKHESSRIKFLLKNNKSRLRGMRRKFKNVAVSIGKLGKAKDVVPSFQYRIKTDEHCVSVVSRFSVFFSSVQRGFST